MAYGRTKADLRYIPALIGGVLLLFLVSGCAQNMLALAYPVPSETIAPDSSAPKICVVLFSDGRDTLELGKRRDGGPFFTSFSAVDWVSRALADELAALGYRVSYSRTIEAARAAGQDFIVTGILEELWLEERSLTSYNCKSKATVSLLDASGGVLFTNNYTATINRTAIPLMGGAESALTETAQDLLRPAARKISLLVSR